MSSFYSQPPAPRKLERSRSVRMIGGVAGGFANYLNMDPTLVRVLLVALTVVTGGIPILPYLVALFLMPEEGSAPPNRPSMRPTQPGFQPYSAADFQPNRSGQPDPVWGNEGAPWEQPQTAPVAPPRPTPVPQPAPPVPQPTTTTPEGSSSAPQSTAPAPAEGSTPTPDADQSRPPT